MLISHKYLVCHHPTLELLIIEGSIFLSNMIKSSLEEKSLGVSVDDILKNNWGRSDADRQAKELSMCDHRKE